VTGALARGGPARVERLAPRPAQRRLTRAPPDLVSDVGPRSPYCKNQGFCMQEPPPRAVSMHCSNELNVQLCEIVAV
jgi:hypothetical protein